MACHWPLFWKVTAPFVSSKLGLEVVYRGRAVVHETGPLEGVIRKLTEGEARGWLSEFSHGRLLCVICVGPGRGDFELTPLSPGAKPFRQSSSPGVALLLRSDHFRVEHLCRTRSLLLSCSFQVSEKASALLPLSPCASRLQARKRKRLLLQAISTKLRRRLVREQTGIEIMI